MTNPHIDRIREALNAMESFSGRMAEKARTGNAALDALAAELDAAKKTADDWQDMAAIWRRRAESAEARVAELERERDAWASSHADRDKLLWAAEARVAQLEAALRQSDAMLSLLRYRATINWDTPGIPDEYDVDKTITQSRAALAAAPADTEGSGRG